MADTMFERYGGFAVVSRVVMGFYDRALDSDILAPYFEDVDMRRLIDHQTKFVSQVMGGPAAYTNDQLKHVHAHLDINWEAFREMMLLFEDTLIEHGFDSEDIKSVMTDLDSRAPYVVNVEK